jgi:hypothetical protein
MVERAYDVWDDGTRCAARSHPGVAHKRRASDSVVTMLDTYDALQWESKDCDDDDAEIIGAFSSDDEADGEDSEKGAADDADDEYLSSSRRSTFAVLMSIVRLLPNSSSKAAGYSRVRPHSAGQVRSGILLGQSLGP